MAHVARSLGFFVFYLVTGGLCAGRWNWLGGWLFAAMLSGGMAAQFAVLAKCNPDLLAERAVPAANTKSWDRYLMPLTVLVLPLAALVVAGLDTRLEWAAPFPAVVQVISLVMGLAAYSLTLVSMVSNRFFSAVVRIQVDRGHAVHADGPYRCVRHPGYLGMLGFFGALPLVLGSRLSLLPALVGVTLHVLRTALEDRTLQAELAGYKQYAARVRFRLIPGVW